MLISPPFLPARGNGQTDSEWISQAMQGGIPGQGGYPVSYNLGWHGGIHLEAPSDGSSRQSVRAIANGTVVYVRKPSKMPALPIPADHPLRYRGGWTSAEWRVPAPGRAGAPFVTVHLKSPTLEVRLFTMLTSIGTPLDVTAEEIHIETYFPADDATESTLRALR